MTLQCTGVSKSRITGVGEEKQNKDGEKKYTVM
jgi:hypothetical protein